MFSLPASYTARGCPAQEEAEANVPVAEEVPEEEAEANLPVTEEVPEEEAEANLPVTEEEAEANLPNAPVW